MASSSPPKINTEPINIQIECRPGAHEWAVYKIQIKVNKTIIV
jgi:hypothetical protein